jgi:DNA helicase II / ATP-dependent DNA helicase PcrA
MLLKLRKTEAECSLQVELSKLKGSLKFAQLLDRYVEHRRNQINVPSQGLRYEDVGGENLKLHLTKEDIAEEHQRVLNQRGTLQRQRDILLERLLQRLSMQAWDQLGRVYGSYKREVEAILRERIAEDLNKIWTAVALQDDYYALLENRPLLEILGKELLTESEIQLLTLSERPTRGKVDAQDLPGLHYLAILLEGVKATYDHIVVDEGQDLSPLQYRLIRMHSKNDSITILGDVAQGICGFRTSGVARLVRMHEA